MQEAGPRSLTRKREPIRARVAVLAVAYACLILLQRSAEATSLSLFLDHLGAKRLPLMFLAASLIDVPLAFAYMPWARRVNRRWGLVGLGAALVGVLVASRLLVGIAPGPAYFLAYLGATALGTFLVIHWGVLLLDAFTVAESRRAFPLVYAAGSAGSFLAGAAMQLAGAWHAFDLLVAIPATSLIGVAAAMLMLGRQSEGQSVRQERTQRAGVAAGVVAWGSVGLLAASPLLRIMAGATALMVLLRLCLRIVYGHELETAFSTPDGLTRFVGAYTMVASGIGLAIQLLVTPRWLRWLGVGKLNFAYAGVVFVALLGLVGLPGLFAATLARFTDLELKGAIKTPISAMFYDAIDPEHRADARAIVLGIVSPVASVGSSLVLLVYTHAQVSVSVLAWGAAAVGAVYVMLSAVQSSSYRTALENQLVRWARDATGDGSVTIEDALEKARGCEDARIVDMAREIRRRRGTGKSSFTA